MNLCKWMVMEFGTLLNKFKNELNQIQLENPDIIKRTNKSIALCSEVLTVLRKEIVKHGFKDIKTEIDFFKHTKQIPLVPLIYNTEIRSFELQFPNANSVNQKKYINKKINKINRFFIYNIDFNQYIKSGLSHFDKQYFTREYLGAIPISYSRHYFQDLEFSTARDMLLGKLMAYNKFIIYLKNRMDDERNSLKDDAFNLKWTSSKSALTELIYALYHSNAINNGNVDIKEVAKALEHIFQFDLGDLYKIFAELKSRKKSRTKFLDELSINLQHQMDKSEE